MTEAFSRAPTHSTLTHNERHLREYEKVQCVFFFTNHVIALFKTRAKVIAFAHLHGCGRMSKRAEIEDYKKVASVGCACRSRTTHPTTTKPSPVSDHSRWAPCQGGFGKFVVPDLLSEVNESASRPMSLRKQPVPRGLSGKPLQGGSLSRRFLQCPPPEPPRTRWVVAIAAMAER